jgi:predicted permease
MFAWLDLLRTMTSYSYKDFKHDLRNVGFVLLVLWVVLAAIGLVYPVAWSFLFAVMLGFVIFDATFGLFLERRKVPISGSHKFQPSGYRFLAFASGIVIASLISATFAEGISGFLTQQSANRLLTLPASFILCVLLYVDFRLADEPP